MTTGNSDTGNRFYSRTFPNGNVQSGVRRTNRSWNGSNSPKRSNSTLPTPKPSKRIRTDRGENPYTLTFLNYNGAPYQFLNQGFVRTAATETSLYVSPSSGWSSNDDIGLVNSLRSQINQSDFDMSVFLGTSHQSLRMIGDTAITIAKGLRNLRKGNIAGAWEDFTGRKRKLRQKPVARTADEMSSRWLEMRYGWMPLLQDIDEGAKAVANLINQPMMVRYVAQSRKYANPPKIINGPTTIDAYKSVRILAKIKENPSLVSKLGLTSPANLAWELLPWSFVADWVLPIGDWLEARSFASSLQGTFIRTEKIFYRHEGYKLTQPGLTMMYPPIDSFCESYTFTRTISSSLSVPMPSVKPLSKVLSWAHAQNGLALLTQQVTAMKRTLR